MKTENHFPPPSPRFLGSQSSGVLSTGVKMPQVHIVGQVLGASGFDEDKLFCKYKVNYDYRSMRLVDGEPEDQTQLSTTNVSCVTLVLKGRLGLAWHV